MYFDEGHGCDCVGGAQDSAEYHDFLESEESVEDEPVDDVAEDAEEYEAEDGADDSEEADDAEVLEEEGLPE